MGRAKGTPKTGGRAKGTPNKITGTLKDFVSGLIEENREQMQKDLQALSSKDRLLVLERFLQYVLPKQQAITADMSVERQPRGIKPDEARAFLERLENEY